MPRSSKWSLSMRCPQQNPMCSFSVPHTCHMSLPSHSSWFDHPNNISWGVVSIMAFAVVWLRLGSSGRLLCTQVNLWVP
jgi:hypothetical protein